MINKVVAFGCGFVVGDVTGHRFRHVPYTKKPLAIYYLGKELGVDRDKCDIIAHGGHSNQYIYRKFYNYIADVKNQKSLDETLFVFGWTGKSRWELYSDVEKTWIPISGDTGELWHIRDIISGKSYEKFIKEYYKVSFNVKEHFEKSVREMISVQNTCKEKKLQYIMFDSVESVFKGSHWPAYNLESKPSEYTANLLETMNRYPEYNTINTLVKLLDKKYWVNYDGKYGDWATMNMENVEEYTAYKGDAHPSALSQKVWGDYLISMVKSLYG
jgi:hypothetical protein